MSAAAGGLLAHLGATLLASLWQGPVVGAVAALALAFARRAAVRYRVACLALLALVVWPALTFVRVALAPAPVPLRAAAAEVPEGAPVGPLLPSERLEAGAEGSAAGDQGARGEQVSPSAPARRVGPGWARLVPWLAGLWLLGVVAGLARLTVGLTLVARLRRSARPAGAEVDGQVARLARRLGLRTRLAVLESRRLAAPVVVGVLRPALLLPVGLAGSLPAAQFEAVLAHELAHVLRRDYLVNLLQRVAETLMFHHPVVWWLSGVVRAEREHACDEAAVRALDGDPLPLVRALAALEARRGSAPLLSMAALGRRARGGALLSRVRRLLGVPGAGSGVGAWPAARPALLLVGLAMVAPVLAQVGDTTAPAVAQDAAFAPFELRYGYLVGEAGPAELFVSLDLAKYVPSDVDAMVVRVRDADGELLGTFPEAGTLIPATGLPVDPSRAASLEVETAAGSWSVPLDLTEPPAGFGPVGELRVEGEAVAGGAVLRWDAVPGAALYEVRLYRTDGGGGHTFRASEPWVALGGFIEGEYEVRIRAFSVDPMVPKQLVATNVAEGERALVDLAGTGRDGTAPGSLQGRLLSAYGPVAGEKVVLWDHTRAPDETGPQVSFPVATTTTDSDGRYRFDGLAPGVYLVQYQGDWPPRAEFVYPVNVVYTTSVAAGRETQAHDLYVVPQLRLLSPPAPARTEPGEVSFDWEPVMGADHYVVTRVDPTRYNTRLAYPGRVLDSVQVEEPSWTVRLGPAQDYGVVIEARDAEGNLVGLRRVEGATRGRAQ